MNSEQRISISLAANVGEEEQEDQDFIQLLKDYQQIIYSCVGPVNSYGKLLTRANDPRSSVWSSSSKLLASILYESKHSNDFINWRFDMINSIVTNAYWNHFYDGGLFLCSLINELLIASHLIFFEEFNNKKLIEKTLKNLYEHLNQQQSNSDSLISIKLDLTNTNHLRKLIHTTLGSKTLIAQLAEDDVTYFVNLCLKGY